LPQLLHRLVGVVAVAVDMAEAADMVEVDMAEVEAFTAGWVEAPVAR
jgi:hypothetical protein